MARILVIDDEEQVISTMRSLLERSGHVVFAADGAETALALISKESIELAIVDLVMPGKGGLTLIMENLASSGSLAVVAMSGRLPVGGDAMARLGRSFGIHCYLAKPFTKEELDLAVSSALAQACA